MDFGCGTFSGSIMRPEVRSPAIPASMPPAFPASGAFALSSPTASSAAIRSPVRAWSCSLSAALSSVTSSARSRAADLDVEHLPVGEVGMVGLDRCDHGIDRAPLERMHGRGPGAVDMAELRVARVHVEHAPVLEPDAEPSVVDPRHLRGLAVDEPEAGIVAVQRMRSPARSSIVSLL